MTYIVIFGATGDLSTKKLFPSLLGLFKSNKLNDSTIIAFSRRDWRDEDFRMFIQDNVNDTEEKVKQSFLNIIQYQKGTFDDLNAFQQLKSRIKDTNAQILFFLAIQPEFHKLVVENLHLSKLDSKQSKILIEKPYGSDYKTAVELDTLIKKYFDEEQLFRIDHYLHKKAIFNLITIRQKCPDMICGLCDNYIEKIELNFLEDIGVEDRGEFYDSTGALRDTGQNHLLEMLAMITAEYDSSKISENRKHILEQVKLQEGSKIIRGQYIGYRKIDGVRENSETETYYKLNCRIDTKNWKNTEIVLESGKSLGIVKKEINLYMRNGDKIKLELSGENRFFFNEKAYDIGVEYKYEDAYEKVFDDAINNKRHCFISLGEVLAAWKFIDPIIKMWQASGDDLVYYPMHTLPV